MSLEAFSTRELAFLIWLALLLAWMLSQSKTRAALGRVVGTLSQRAMVTALAAMAVYIVLMAAALHALGAWRPSQLKDTLIWSVSVAAVSLFSLNEIAADRAYFKNAVLDNFRLTLVVEFILGSYTLALWAELILAPVLAFLGGLLAYAQRDEKHHAVATLIGSLLALIGASLIGYAGYRLVTDFQSFARLETAANFVLAPLLSLAFLPFLFVMALYVSYEGAFLRLRFAIKDPALRAFAQRRAVRALHVRTELLRRWARNIAAAAPTDRDRVDDSIQEVLKVHAREHRPEPVPFDLGWSPFLAVRFLEEQGVLPGDYHRDPYEDGGWYAQSGPLEVGAGLFPGHVFYTVEGGERIATTLKLTLHVDADQSGPDCLSKFLDVAKALYARALGEEMPEALQNRVAAGADATESMRGRRVSLVREPRPASRLGGYDLRFRVEMQNG